MIGPRISIAMPVKNGANFLAEAIDSALAQTYANLEVIVVDDGSDDGGATEAVALGYGDRIKFIRQANTGVAGALNRVLREMTGDLFCWLSHDDVFEPIKVAFQVASYVRMGSPRDVVLYSDFSWIDEESKITGVERIDRREMAHRPWLAFYNGLINGCTILAPRQLLLDIGGIVDGHPHTQDYQTWWRLIRHARLVHIPVPLVRVRRHGNQGSNTQPARQESDALWKTVIEETSELEAVLLDGSRERFLRRSADFLRYRSPNRVAADRALDLAKNAAIRATVAVVLDLGADAAGVERAMASVLTQTRPPNQLVLVGAYHDLHRRVDAAIGASDVAVVWVSTVEAKTSARLRAGLMMATGSYVAFLLASDAFEPDKIARQVEAMSANGSVISHTSYRKWDGTLVPSGTFAGRVYPEILASMPVETSTVMIHRALWSSGILFAERNVAVGASWVEATARFSLLGLDKPLSMLRPSTPCDLTSLLHWAETHHRHHEHYPDLARLRVRIKQGEQF